MSNQISVKLQLFDTNQSRLLQKTKHINKTQINNNQVEEKNLVNLPEDQVALK